MVIILAYHGVTEIESSGIENLQGKHLAAGTFEEHMRQLRETEQILRLSELVEAYERGEHLDGVVVTFDDGYRNNYTVALPIMERYGIPATFFFSTGFIGTTRMFWVDEVEFLIDRCEVEAVDLHGFGLQTYPLVSQRDKVAAVTEIKASLKQINDGMRGTVLEALKAQLPVRAGGNRSPNYEVLRWEEVRAIAEHPLCEVGAHSVNHAILTRLTPDQVEQQVRESKAALEAHLGRAVTVFAYPNGGPGDYDANTMDAVRRAGFRCGCTTIPGINEPSTGLFELKRNMVGFCGEPFPVVDAAHV